MEIKNIKCKSGNEYNIVNESWETSSSWGHKSTLLQKNGYEIDSHKIRYINRTWECYTYQSCMFRLIEDILKENEKSYITQYKEKNGISRITKTQKELALNEWNEKTYIQDLKEIHDRIENRKFD